MQDITPQTNLLTEGNELAVESAIRQFVIFVAGDEVFAVDMQPVQEIIRVPVVVRVPLSPPILDGLANLRGKVLPIISLRRIFGFDECAYDDATRAVVVDQGQALGFVVDRVVSVVGIDSHRIEDTKAISSTINSELVSGLIRDIGEHKMVMILDFAKLVAQEFAGIGNLKRTNNDVIADTRTMTELTIDATAGEISDELHLVSFEVAGQEYAITINEVQEIMQMPELIVHVPHTQAHVLGVMTLRNRLMPLVSLRCMFGLPVQAADENSRILVVSLGPLSVGIVMDRVKEVLRVKLSDVDAMPNMLAKDGNLSEIAQICRLEGGKRLVSILSVDILFRHSAIQEALTTANVMNDKQVSGKEKIVNGQSSDEEEQVVIFRLGNEEYGVVIDSVQEIVRVPDELTHVPKAPREVEGVINLRGAVLPVIDLRRRLGLDQVERSDRQRIMVFLLQGMRTGFIVDSVAEVLKIHKSAIEPTPRLSGEQRTLLPRMANLEKQKRMVQLIDPDYLVGKQELVELAELSAT